MVVVNLTPEQLNGLRAAGAANPTSRKVNELIVEYATTHGGEVRAFWRLARGDLFDEPIIMSHDDCAQRLG